MPRLMSAVGDDVTNSLTGTLAVGGDDSAILVMMWVHPNTLTAGRTLFGQNNTGFMRFVIDSVTSELDLISNNVTTDGIWTTSDLGLVTGQWQFLAILGSFQDTAGPTAAWAVWKTGRVTPPQLVTAPTQTTAPVGNFSSAVPITIGNSGNSASVAFQGEIGPWMVMKCGFGAPSPGTGCHPLIQEAAGTITAVTTDSVYNKYVLPAWLGNWGQVVANCTGLETSITFSPMSNIEHALGVMNTLFHPSGTYWNTFTGASSTSVLDEPRFNFSRPGFPFVRR